MFPDLIASAPIQDILATDQKYNSLVRVARFQRIYKLIRITKLLRLIKLFKIAQKKRYVNIMLKISL